MQIDRSIGIKKFIYLNLSVLYYVLVSVFFSFCLDEEIFSAKSSRFDGTIATRAVCIHDTKFTFLSLRTLAFFLSGAVKIKLCLPIELSVIIIIRQYAIERGCEARNLLLLFRKSNFSVNSIFFFFFRLAQFVCF